MRRVLELGALNAVSYFILTCDMRSVAQANIAWAAVLNLLIAFLSFTILKRVAEARGMGQRISYAIGGTLGTVVGIYATKAVLGQ